MKNAFNGLISKLNPSEGEKKINELEDKSTITQTETYRGQKGGGGDQSTASRSCQSKRRKREGRGQETLKRR